MPVDRHVRVTHTGKHRHTHQYAHAVSTRHIRTHMHTDTLTYVYVHTTPMHIHTDPHKDTHIHALEHTVRPKQTLQKGLSSLHGVHTCRDGAGHPHTCARTAPGKMAGDCPPLPALPSAGSRREQCSPPPSLIRTSLCGLLHGSWFISHVLEFACILCLGHMELVAS